MSRDNLISPQKIQAAIEAMKERAEREGRIAEGLATDADRIALASDLFESALGCLDPHFPDPADFLPLCSAAAKAALGHLRGQPAAARVEPKCRAQLLSDLALAFHRAPLGESWGEAGAQAAASLAQGLPKPESLAAFAQAPAEPLAAFVALLQPSSEEAFAAAIGSARSGELSSAAVFLKDPTLLLRPAASEGGACPLAIALDEGLGLRALLQEGAPLAQLKNFDLTASGAEARSRFRDIPNDLEDAPFFCDPLSAIAAWDSERDISPSEMARLILFGAPASVARPAIEALRRASAGRAEPPSISAELALSVILLADDATLAERAELALELCPNAGAEHARQLLCRLPLGEHESGETLLPLALRCAKTAFRDAPVSLLEDSRRLDHPAQFSADLLELALRSVYTLNLEAGSREADPALQIMGLCFKAGQNARDPLPGRNRSAWGKLSASRKKLMKGWLHMVEGLEIGAVTKMAPPSPARSSL